MQDLEKICKTWENARLHKMQAGENRQMGKYARLEKDARSGKHADGSNMQDWKKDIDGGERVGLAPANFVRGTQMRSGKLAARLGMLSARRKTLSAARK